MPSQLEGELIMNRLSFPKNYNGFTWNTRLGHSRSSIPEYLHEDLPPLQYAYIREEFKHMNQIECPRITYFKNKILFKKARHPDPPPALRRIYPFSNNQKQQSGIEKELIGIRQQLKYALMTNDRNCNVIGDLIGRANILEQKKQILSKGKYKKKINRGHSLSNIEPEYNCFPDTLGLVVSGRKQRIKRESSIVLESDVRIKKRVQSIKLLAYN